MLFRSLVEAWADAHEIPLVGVGSVTLRRKPKKAGLEPDECYCLARLKPVPDLAIEVVNTTRVLRKLDVYRRIGVGEVWIWEQGAIRVFLLRARGYEEVAKSRLLRGLDLIALAGVVAGTDLDRQAQAVWAFRAAAVARASSASTRRARTRRSSR